MLDQLEYLDLLVARDTGGRITNPPGLYIMYVRDNVAPPADFGSSRKKALAVQAIRRRAVDQGRAAQQKLDYEAFCAAETARFIAEEVPADEYRSVAETHRRKNRALLKHLSPHELEEITRRTVRSEIERSGRVKLLDYEQFIRASAAPAAPATEPA